MTVYDRQEAAECNRLGMAAVTEGRHGDALIAFQQAIDLDPVTADYHANFGLVLLLQQEHPGAAIVAFQQALRLQPGLPIVHGYLGAAHSLLGQDQQAIAHLRTSLAEPSVFAYHQLSMIYFRMGRWQDGLQCCEHVLAIKPDDAAAHFNRGLNLLALGRYQEGWSEFDWRRLVIDPRFRFVPAEYGIPHVREWKGEDIRDKHLLLHFEGGMGDSIQFARFIPDIAARCRKLSIYERPSGQSLLRHNFSANATVCPSVPPDVDYYMLMMSAGRLLELDGSNIARPPYLTAPASNDWSHRFTHLPRPRVGLVWAGGVTSPVDARRSLSLAEVAPLFDVPLSWVSLQMGREETCPIYDAAPFIHAWADTAAAIEHLDLVISVDTAVAHLAGAMGKPVWLLNRFDSCWRWGTTGETTPWYDMMRIFRQPRLGDWGSVIREVIEALSVDR